MSDPQSEYMSEMQRVLEESGPKVLARWADVLENGGEQTVNVKCSSCGRGTRAKVPIADVEAQRRIMDFLTTQVARHVVTPEEDLILRDVRNMTDEEIAEELARLNRQQSAAHRELVDLCSSLEDEDVKATLIYLRKKVRAKSV